MRFTGHEERNLLTLLLIINSKAQFYCRSYAELSSRQMQFKQIIRVVFEFYFTVKLSLLRSDTSLLLLKARARIIIFFVTSIFSGQPIPSVTYTKAEIETW
jgi:hypothetical protein